jgi:hypothetical protein
VTAREGRLEEVERRERGIGGVRILYRSVQLLICGSGANVNERVIMIEDPYPHKDDGDVVRSRATCLAITPELLWDFL